MRVLVLTHRLPYAPNRGDRLRVYHMLQYLRTRAEVELISLVHDDEEEARVDDVRGFVSRVTAFRVPKWRSRAGAAAALLTQQPLTHALLDAPGLPQTLREVATTRRPDVVFAYCSGMARFALEPPLDDIPLVLDFVDVDSRKWRDLGASSRWPQSWIYAREARTLGSFEARAAAHAVSCLVVNEREAGIARSLTLDADVQVVSNGVEIERLRPTAPASSKPQVVFCGVMDYAPNDAGMQWFVRQVWPLIRSRRHDAALAIVGSGPTRELSQLCAADPSITITGKVADVREWLWASAVSVAPLHVARGVQNKALEAIAAGLPIVITEAVAGGLPPEAASASLVAYSADGFAEHVLTLLDLPPAERRARAASADLSQLTWTSTLETLWPILNNAAQSGSHAFSPATGIRKEPGLTSA